MKVHWMFKGLDTCTPHLFCHQVVHYHPQLALNPRQVQQQRGRVSHAASAHTDTLRGTSSNGNSSSSTHDSGAAIAIASSTSSNGRRRAGREPVQPAAQQQQQLASTQVLHVQQNSVTSTCRSQQPDQQEALQQQMHTPITAGSNKQQRQQQQLGHQRQGLKRHGVARQIHQQQRQQRQRQQQERAREHRWQLHQQTLQQQEHLMQQRQQLLQQHLLRCTHWQQLLPIAAAPIAQTDPAWVAAVAVKAAQLQPFPATTAAAADARAEAVQSSSSNSTAASAAMTAVLSTSGLAGNSSRADSSQHLYFVNQLLLLLGTQLAAATAAAAAPGPPAALLCQLLSQLAAINIRLPPGWLQDKLVPYIRTRYTRMQPEEVLGVLVGLSAVQPKGLAVQIGLQKRLLRSIVSERRPFPPVQQVAHVLHAAARLKWRPSQQWVQQAAMALLQQVRQCTPSELAMALWGLAMLGCDMTLLQGSLLQAQQQQQQPLQGSSTAGTSGSPTESDQEQHAKQQQQQQAVPLSMAVQQAVQTTAAVQRPVALAPQQLLQSVLNCAAELNAQELLCVLWATAELPLLPQQQLVQTLLSYCLQPFVLQQYSPADLSGILWFLARMQYQADIEQWQQQQQQSSLKQWVLKHRKQRQQSGQQQQQLTLHDNTLVALHMVQPVLDALLFQLPLLRSQHLATAMRSIALLGLQPPRHWVARVLHHSNTLVPDMQQGCLVQLVAAVADLKYLPSDNWLSSVYAATQPHLVAFAAAAAGAAASSSSSSSGSTSANSSSSTIRAREVEVLAGAVLKLSTFHSQPRPSQKPPAAWLTALAQASARVLAGSPSPEQLSFWGRVLHRFSSLAGEPWLGPGRDWWLQYVQLTQSILATGSPWVLSNVIHVLAQPRQQRQIVRLSPNWVQDFLEASREVLRPTYNRKSPGHSRSSSDLGDLERPRFDQQDPRQQGAIAASAADLVAIGKSLARLQVLPDQAWQRDWLSAVEQADASMTTSMRATVSWAVSTFKTLAEQQQEQNVQEPTLLPPHPTVADAPMLLQSNHNHMSNSSTSGGKAGAEVLQQAPAGLTPTSAAAAVTLTYSDEEFETLHGDFRAGSSVGTYGTASTSDSSSSSSSGGCNAGADTATRGVLPQPQSGRSLMSVDGGELAKQLHDQWEHQQRSIDGLQDILKTEISKMQRQEGA